MGPVKAHCRNEANAQAPFLTGLTALVTMTWFYVLGRLQDLIHCFEVSTVTRKGYAPVREKEEDFYIRRVFGRIQDCWNRPISSAPDAWVDVVEREAPFFESGFSGISTSFTGTSKHCLNLGSYNYLGFAAADEYCTPRVQDTLARIGCVSSCASRVDGGTTDIHVALEKEIAKFVGKEDAVVVGMGYATNSSVIPVLAGKGALIISDALNHASIVVGARASGAKIKVFRHNDAGHLDAVLRNAIADGQPRTHRPWKKIIIIVEGIYSMEGETCTLPAIVEVARKYRAYIYLDEAHSIGALGRTGRGATEHWGVATADIDIMMGTFTKSFGSCGGYIAGDKATIDYLRRHGPAHLYATAVSPGAAQQIMSAFKLIDGDDGTTRGQDKIRQLHDNANYFRMGLLARGFHVLGDWDSPVMPLMIYHPAKLPCFSRLCLEQNVAAVVVGFPATPVLLTRARVCISASHTKEDLDFAMEVIDHVGDTTWMKYRPEAERAQQVVSLLESVPCRHPNALMPYSNETVSAAIVAPGAWLALAAGGGGAKGGGVGVPSARLLPAASAKATVTVAHGAANGGGKATPGKAANGKQQQQHAAAANGHAVTRVVTRAQGVRV
ncbi:hypothetical protein FOA52_014374 [Chlamydomonas sp. UWO 241]|nr:hypothetical protein FOA52_014374 [Chlamydomonas sp. UWO 241]